MPVDEEVKSTEAWLRECVSGTRHRTGLAGCCDERPDGSGVRDEGHRAGGPLKVPTATGSCYCRRFRYARSPRRPVPNRNREAGTGTESTVAEVMNGSPPEASPKLLMVIVLSVCEANSTGSAYVCMSRCTSPLLGVDLGI